MTKYVLRGDLGLVFVYILCELNGVRTLGSLFHNFVYFLVKMKHFIIHCIDLIFFSRFPLYFNIEFTQKLFSILFRLVFNMQRWFWVEFFLDTWFGLDNIAIVIGEMLAHEEFV